MMMMQTNLIIIDKILNLMQSTKRSSKVLWGFAAANVIKNYKRLFIISAKVTKDKQNEGTNERSESET